MQSEPSNHGNPYANITDADDRKVFVKTGSSAATGPRHGGVLVPGDAINDQFLPTLRPAVPNHHDAEHVLHGKRPEGNGNPYAYIVEDEEHQPHTASALVPANPAEGLAKGEFNTICRTIFARYIPAAEHGRLRPHHREFIARNESRSPKARRLLANALRRYDLADTPGLASQFNRGEFEFTEAKLKQIEQTVLSEADE